MSVSHDASDTAAAPRDRRRWLLPLLSVLAILAALAMFWSARSLAPSEPELVLGAPVADSPFAGFAITPPREAPGFELIASTGEPLRLDDLRGRVVLLFFGYTFCPDVCPQTMTKVAHGLRELGDDADAVTPVFVSVDPNRDTLDVIGQFVAGYGPQFLGATGDPDTLRAMADDYAVTYFVDEEEGQEPDPRFYTITHSATVFLIDTEGRLRASFLGPYTPNDVAHDVRVVLAEGDGAQAVE